MRLKERLQLIEPELTRLDLRTIAASIPLGVIAGMGISSQTVGDHTFYYLLGLPLAKVLFWAWDLSHPERLQAMQVERSRAAYKQGRDQVRKLRKSCRPSKKVRHGISAFGIQFLGQLTGAAKDDQKILERIEDMVDEIGNQYKLADYFVQRQLLSIMPQVIQQGVCAMQIGQKLTVLQNFLEHADLVALENEERELRDEARQQPVGPLGTLHAQTSRFKVQQIINVRNAMETASLYRAQLRALEAGLGNIQGRMASMIAISHEDAVLEMEALDAELAALDEGMKMASRVVNGGSFHATYPSYQTPTEISTEYVAPRSTTRSTE